MSNDLIIRSPVESDLTDIIGLVQELNEHQGDPVDFFRSETAKQDIFGDDRTFDTLVAELKEEIVGYVFFHPSYESGYAERGLFICDLHVKKKARRQGIAKALVKAVAREADQRGFTFLWWASKLWNVNAQKFYEEIGAISEPVIAHALIHDAFKKMIED